MPVYTLDDKTYEIFPNISNKEEPPALTPRQLNQIAHLLSEHFGCFILFGMSFQGTPQVILSGSSGMEQLALKKFAEDVILGETDVNFLPLDQTEEEDDD